MKSKVLATATEMFLNFGFKSVTMDDIAQKMCISKKTIYSHYCNKRKLVEEATFGIFDAVCSGIDDINNARFNPIEELYQIKKLMLESLNDEKSSPIFQLEKYYPKIHKTLMERKFEVMQSCVSENLQRGIDEGYFRTNIDVSLITRVYFKGVTGLKDPVIFPVETYEAGYVLENYLDYHVRGIATEKGLQTLEQTQIKYNS